MPSVDSCVSNIFRDLNFSDTTVSTVVRTYALGILATPVLTGTEGIAYTGFTASGTGGIKPYTYSLQGSWPAGLGIDSSTGAVSGTPTTAGSYPSLSIRVTDVYGVTADTTTFTILITHAFSLDFSQDYNSLYLGIF